MIKKSPLNILILFPVLALFFSNCQKFENVAVDGFAGEYAVPIFQGKASMADVLDNLGQNTYLTFGSDSLFFLNYRGTVAGLTSENIFSLFSDTPPFPVDTFMALPLQLPNNLEIDHVQLKSGTMTYSFISNHKETLDLNITIPQASIGSTVFSEKLSVPYNGQVPIIIPPQEVDLTGYSLNTINDSLFIQYDAITQSGEKVTLDNFLMVIRNLEFSYAEGFLGSEVLSTPSDTIAIDFFQYFSQGSVFFEDPKVKLQIINSFGFPFRAKANFINFITPEGELLPLESSFIDKGVDIDYPRIYEVGQSKITAFTFDKTNSNLQQILAGGPVQVEYNVDIIPNPDNDRTITGYMTDRSEFDIQVEVQLPIEGRTAGFVTQDSFAIDLSEYERIDFAEFKLTSENELPLGVEIQISFVDSVGTLLDYLFENEKVILEPAPIDDQGEVTSTSFTTTLAPLDAHQFERIKTAKKGLIDVRFMTSRNGSVPVRVLASQQVDLQMGMRIGFK